MHFARLSFLYLIILICYLVPSSSFASDFHSPRTAALGGAGHAGPVRNDAIYLNPSFTPFERSRGLSFNYLMFGGGQIPLFGGLADYYGHNINLSVIDGSKDALFQAGVAYTRRDDASFIHVGAAKSAIDRLGFGLGGKFIFPNSPSAATLTDASASFTGIATKWLNASIVVDNIFESGINLNMFREYTLGTKINLMDIVTFYFDPHWIPTLTVTQSTNGTVWGFESGMEITIMTDISIRGGFYNNSTVPFQGQKGNGWAAGGGYAAPKLSVDYSYSRVNYPIASYAHNFGVSIFF